MTIWLLILLVIVVAAAAAWLSNRRRRRSHPGTGYGDPPAEGVWSKDPWHGGQ
jgi:hypothetical protein